MNATKTENRHFCRYRQYCSLSQGHPAVPPFRKRLTSLQIWISYVVVLKINLHDILTWLSFVHNTRQIRAKARTAATSVDGLGPRDHVLVCRPNNLETFVFWKMEIVWKSIRYDVKNDNRFQIFQTLSLIAFCNNINSYVLRCLFTERDQSPFY